MVNTTVGTYTLLLDVSEINNQGDLIGECGLFTSSSESLRVDLPLTPSETDSDNDGIPDLDDDCDSTPPNEPVYGTGCSDSETDSDNDGVMNNLDLCPETLENQAVNADGCSQYQLDSDNDGVSNAVDQCPNTPSGEQVNTAGCSSSQLDTDGDGVGDNSDMFPNDASETVDTDGDGVGDNSDAFPNDASETLDTDGDGVNDGIDECPDTEVGYPVDSDGCFDEDALDQDLDGDGYLGEYTFDIDDATGLRINEAGDAFPLDGTQWFDQDGDGFGDNPVGDNADFCPTEFGTSYLDALEIGCEDDGDGWADNWGRDKFPGDATQWNDSDGDGYGDNWGVEAWNDSRDSSMPGEFVTGASTPDKCPQSPTTNVDDEGCSTSERDTDQDGVNDLLDNCPEQPKGPDGFDDGSKVGFADGEYEDE